MSVNDILKKTELILISSIILGLSVSLTADIFRTFIDYILGIVMFFSIRPFFQHEFNIHTRFKSILLSILFNYGLLSGLFLIFASLFFEPLTPFYISFILLAVVPPAISIVPLCYLTQCDPETADASLFASFFLSLIIIPTALSFIFGKSINILMLIRVIMVIIVIPIILAYFSRKSENRIFDYTKSISNVCIGLVIFIVISSNRSVFFIFNTDIIKIYIAVIISIFGGGLLVYYVTKRFFSRAESINFSLYASQKNEGTALAIAVLFFTPSTIVPIIIALVCQFIYFMIFKKFVMSKLETE
jgi:BASS family bile acid:Na+ symporter